VIVVSGAIELVQRDLSTFARPREEVSLVEPMLEGDEEALASEPMPTGDVALVER
jgi:hypothetical protein